MLRPVVGTVVMLLALPAWADEPRPSPPPAPPAPAAPAPGPAAGQGATTAPTPAAPAAPSGGTAPAGTPPATVEPDPSTPAAPPAPARARRRAPPPDEESDGARGAEDEEEPEPESSFLRPKTDAWKRPTRIAGWVALGAAGALALSTVGAFGAHGYYAGRWNDDARCLVPGRYRFSICGDDYNQATSMETLGVQLAIATGVVGVTAVVMLLATRPPSPPKKKARRRTVSCLPDPLSRGVACAGVF